MSQRDYQLSFCRYCTNQQFDYQEGIICGLSKAKATFNSNCPDFKVGQVVVEEFRKKFKATHPVNLDSNEKLNDDLDQMLKRNAISVRKSSYKYLAPILGLIGLVMTITIITMVFSATEAEARKAWLIPLLFFDIIIIMIVLGQSNLNRDEVIRLSNNGIEIDGKTTEWANYLGFEYHREEEGFGVRKNVYHSIVIKFIGRQDVEIDISMLSMSRRKLMKTLQWFEMKKIRSINKS